MRFGFHISIEGGLEKSVERAVKLGVNTFQIFTRSPRMWKERDFKKGETQKFKKILKDQDIWPVYSHMPYLPNLSSPNSVIYEKSIKTLEIEIKRSQELGIPFIVTHLGSHLGSGLKNGLNNLISAIKTTLNKTEAPLKILLENTSGKKNEVGSTFGELKHIIDQINDERIGICIDTCHLFAKGYDIKTKMGLKETLFQFDQLIGLEKLKLVHLNDSIGTLGSKIDRHYHIGLGEIGEEGFRNILQSDLKKCPMIMETPVDDIRGNLENLEKVYELVSS